MPLSLYLSTVPVFERSLKALDGILAKAQAFAAARKIDESVLLNMRLSPDMFALVRQVQICCDFAISTTARLSAQEPKRFEANETNFETLRTLIAKTLQLVASADRAAIDASEGKTIVFAVGPQKRAQLPAQDYVLHFAMPNFAFHYVTSYAILRHAGVEIGKMDYLGQIPGFSFVD